MPKTASTSIQMAFSGFDDGVWQYPDLKQSQYFGFNHGLSLFTLYSDAPENHIVHRVEGRDRADIDALNRILKISLDSALANRDRNLFLSGEVLSSTGPDDPYQARLYADLARESDRTDVLAYVRPFRSYMTSWFQQRMHRSPVVPPLDQVVPHYRATLGLWANVVPQDRIRFVPFDPRQDPVRDMADRLGVTAPPSRRENVARCLEATAILYAHKRLGHVVDMHPGKTAALRAVQERIARIGTGRFALSDKLTDPLAEAFRADLHWMAERLDLPGHQAMGFVDDRGFGTGADAVRSLDDLLDIAGAQLEIMMALTPEFTPPDGDRVSKVCACLDELYRRAAKPEAGTTPGS